MKQVFLLFQPRSARLYTSANVMADYVYRQIALQILTPLIKSVYEQDENSYV